MADRAALRVETELDWIARAQQGMECEDTSTTAGIIECCSTGTESLPDESLNPAGGITSALNLAPMAQGGVGGLTPAQVENATQFTYYFRAEHPGTYMYHCHIVASVHVQMGMYGALIIRPRDGNAVTGNIMYNNVYGPIALSAAGAAPNSDSFDKEYTFVLSEIDPNWHNIIEQGKRKAFYPPMWNPEDHSCHLCPPPPGTGCSCTCPARIVVWIVCLCRFPAYPGTAA